MRNDKISSRGFPKGKPPRTNLTRARILLQADQGPHGPALSDEQIQQALHVGRMTVERTRKACVEQGIEAALRRKHRSIPGYQKFDGEKEAHLIAVVCSTPPKGQKRWTLQLLADKMIELEHFDSICPPEAHAACVCAMEDVLNISHRPHSPAHPLICLDASSKQHVMETCQPIEATPGQV